MLRRSTSILVKTLKTTENLWNHRLISRREELGLSVPDVARRIVGSDDHDAFVAMREKISSYEKFPKDKPPVQQPRGNTMQQIATALETTVEWLRDGNPEVAGNVKETIRNPNPEVAKSNIAQIDFPPNAGLANEPLTKTRRRIDIVGRAAGGREGKFILNGDKQGYIYAPPSVEAATNPYAVYVFGDSMSPRYDDGEMVIANPDLPYRKGNYVVVQLLTGEENVFECYVKRFISFGKDLVLEQLNPPKGSDAMMRFPGERVHAIHKLVGPDGK